MEARWERLHICLGAVCNNNCLFCMEGDRDGRSRHLSQVDTEAAKRLMSSLEVRDEVLFTAGEPTLRSDLACLIREARDLGYQRIGLISNGRRLSYLPYLQELLDAGLNHIVVSIHGHNAPLHDGLTRCPGSFEQTTQGMRHLARFREFGRTTGFVTATVLNRRNLSALPDLLVFLQGFNPDETVFNAIQPVGRGEQHFARLVPRYSDIVSQMQDAIETTGVAPNHVRLLDVPRCVTGSLPNESVGFVERHRHFEPEAGIQDELRGRDDSQRQEGFVLVRKEDTDRVMREFLPGCVDCVYRVSCDGIWSAILEHHGSEEFRPVQHRRSQGDD